MTELRNVLFAQCAYQEARRHKKNNRPSMEQVLKRFERHPLNIGHTLTASEATQLYTKLFARRFKLESMEDVTIKLVNRYINEKSTQLGTGEGKGPLAKRIRRICRTVRGRQSRPSASPRPNRAFQARAIALLDDMQTWRSSSFFAHPASEKQYYDVVKSPTDLKTIKAEIKSGKIRTSAEFEREIQKMFANSIMYNPWDSQMAQWTHEMQLEAEGRFQMLRELDT